MFEQSLDRDDEEQIWLAVPGRGLSTSLRMFCHLESDASHCSCSFTPHQMGSGGWSTISFMSDPWIADMLFSRKPTFIDVDISDSLSIPDLLLMDGSQWNPIVVTRVFSDVMRARVLSIPLPIYACTNIRVWRTFSIPRAAKFDLRFLFSYIPQWSLDIAWILRISIYPRVSLFL